MSHSLPSTSRGGAGQWAVWIGLGLAVYALSIGPVVALYLKIHGPNFSGSPDVIDRVYAPVFYVAENSAWFSRALDGYEVWWDNFVDG